MILEKHIKGTNRNT